MEILQKKVEDVMKEVCNIDSDLDEFLSHFHKERIISELQEILNLFERNCQSKGCVGQCSVVNTKSEGGVLIVSWKCTEGHNGMWESSVVLGVKRGQKVYAATVLLAASIVVSGNNFDKLSMLMKFLNVSFLSESTFSCIQTCVTPVVKELWEAMKEKLWEVLKGEELALAGDGRNDSPGHSAKYCVYTIMEHYLHLIMDIEVVDKRETGGSSATMEKLALKRLIERAMTDLKIVDLVTDTSSMIIALTRTLKEKNPSHLEDLFHSLDMWHKSCKLTAKLSVAAKVRGCDDICQWIEPIRNHFWHCAEQCDGNEETLRDMWLGVTHHVCGEHEWVEGECSHGPLVSTEQGKTFLEMDSKSHKAVHDIVMDRAWLKTLAFYVKFRHTSKLESFNSMMLKYASKRMAFSYDVFMTRILLAALDHNVHLFRTDLEDSMGQVR
ncbi:uncharacterized protein LOC110061841 [Orbicella faveolata]|uniref:uncharacterized protein LOC110061841 n=1 Tax=Orbicella faveolata TaxID=48498 RepID=UPI0009E6390F|nr:uncharacterized protein LOC110061841 [Orbicella faveolata]